MKSQIEKIVTSLEVSRKLKALGIIQESCFYWVRFPREKNFHIASEEEILELSVGKNVSSAMWSDISETIVEKISAFTVTELAVMMCHCTFGNDTYECFMIHPDDYANTISKSEIKQCNRNLKKWRDK